MKMNNASLIVVGLGIKLISHLTNEAKVYIEQSDKVLYLVNEPVMKEWISKVNPRAESLDDLYTKHSLRIDCYRAITEYILAVLRQNLHVCVVLYGHPTVFAQPALDAVIEARKQGYYAKALPAISAEDCLFADLLIDPGSSGCHSFEATDFLVHKRRFDPGGHLILWQISCIGILGHAVGSNQNGLNVLLDYLKKYYTLDHEVILYEASQYPHLDPRITKVHLELLAQAQVSQITTLYVPPREKALFDRSMFEALHTNSTDIQ